MIFDEGLAQRIRELICDHVGHEENIMFGGIGFLVRGNMACGVIGDGLTVRVGAEEYPEALLKPDIDLFDLTSRTMTGWVIVKEPGYRKDNDLKAWVDQGSAYSLSLPIK